MKNRKKLRPIRPLTPGELNRATKEVVRLGVQAMRISEREKAQKS